MNSESQPTFRAAIKEYSTIAFRLWPALKLALCNLAEVEQPPKDSMLPILPYSNMSNSEFVNAIAEGLTNYIESIILYIEITM